MSRIVDLTLTLRSGMRGVKFETARTLEQDGWNAKTLELYSHCGTHMDAPIHFGAGNGTIDALPLERCMADAWVVDPAHIGPRVKIRPEDLGEAAEKVRPGEGLLIRTGWSRYVEDARYRDELPGISRDLARWCAEKRVGILGVEPPSVADVSDREELAAVHGILFNAGIVIVEGLANLESITESRVFFMAFPLKVFQGDGAPARALAKM